MNKYQFDLFTPPVIERRAEIPAGMTFQFGGRTLLVVRTFGTDAAAPVIVEELTNAVAFKGQLGLWSADDIQKRIRLVKECHAGLDRCRALAKGDQQMKYTIEQLKIIARYYNLWVDQDDDGNVVGNHNGPNAEIGWRPIYADACQTALEASADSKDKAAREVSMTRERALPYVRYCVDDALGERAIAEMPPHARLVGWQCGFEPLFVAVWSYLSDDPIDPCEAEELATDLLAEKKWFTDNEDPPSADYVI